MFAGVLVLSTRTLQAGLFLVNATNAATAVTAINFIWDPSPDPRAAGYFLCWGLSNGECTNKLNVLNTNSAAIGGFEADVVYYFCVIAYDAFGEESPPSNEAQYVTSGPPPPIRPRLSFEPPTVVQGGIVVPLGFQGTAGSTYQIQATADFLQWETIWSIYCDSSAPVTVQITNKAVYDRRFFRLQVE
jgi:hypothetical protein